MKIQSYERNSVFPYWQNMGLFRKLFRSAPDSTYIDQLIATFTRLAGLLELSVGKATIQQALQEAKQSAKAEDKIYKLPDQYGDRVLYAATQGDSDSQAFVRRALRGGAHVSDIRAWWNLPDLERRMYEWLIGTIHTDFYHSLQRQGLSDIEVFSVMKRILPFYGDPADESYLSGGDRPLPSEMILWVFDFTRQASGQLHPRHLQEQAASYSSMNAYLRWQHSLEKWSELMAPIHAYFRTHQFGLALREAEKLLPKLEEQLREDDPVRRHLMMELTPVFMEGGRYDITIPWLEKAVDKADPHAAEYPILLNNLGQHYTEMGRSQEAASLFQQALKLLQNQPQQAKADFLWVRILHNLALAFAREMQFEEAVPLYEQAIQYLEKQKGELARNLLDVYRSNLSLSYLGLMRLEEAFEVQLLALQSRKQVLGPDHPHLANSLDSLGHILTEQGAFQQSISYLEAAAHIRKQSLGSWHPDFTLSLSNLSLAYTRVQAWDQAILTQSQAVRNRLDQIRNQFLYLPEAEQQAFSRQLYMELELFRSLTARLYHQHPEMLELLFEIQIQSRGLQIRSLRQLKQRVQNSSDPQIQDAFNRWLQTKSRLAETYALKDPQGRGKLLEREVQDLEEYLRKHVPLFAQELQDVPHWKELQKALTPGECLVECFSFTPLENLLEKTPSICYGAMFLSEDSPSLTYISFPALEQLESEIIQSYHDFLNFDKSQLSRSLVLEPEAYEKEKAENLYKRLWHPVQHAIRDCHKVYLLPDRLFYHLNIETLWKPESQQYVGDELEVQVLHHATDLLESQRPASKRPAVLMGDPDFGNSPRITYLPGTRKEILSIARLLEENGRPTEVYLGVDALSFTLKSVQSPSVLHVATHGFFEQERHQSESIGGFQQAAIERHPYLRSGLLLTGAAAPNPFPEGGVHPGVLTAYEAANLNLIDTELVILSACNTGNGDVQNEEGVYGLSRAFREAGSQAVMYSLWPVSDEATVELMQLFYQRWLAGSEMRAAFLEARQVFRRRYPEPYIWGAFLLV